MAPTVHPKQRFCVRVSVSDSVSAGYARVVQCFHCHNRSVWPTDQCDSPTCQVARYDHHFCGHMGTGSAMLM